MNNELETKIETNRRIIRSKVGSINKILQGQVAYIDLSLVLMMMNNFGTWMRPPTNSKGTVSVMIYNRK